MSLTQILETAQSNLEPVADVGKPTRVEEIDSFLGVNSVYDPLRDSIEIDPETSEEDIENVEMDLVEKYVVDQTIGDTGLQEIDELEEELELYHQIDKWKLFDDEKEDDRLSPEEREELEEELFDEPPERDEDLPTREEMDQISESMDDMDLEMTKRDIGDDEELTRRLAALRLSDRTDEIVEEYRQKYRDLEERKRRVREGYHRWDEEVHWEKFEDLIEDEDARMEVVQVKTKLMEDQMEIMERTEEMKDEDELMDDLLAGADPVLNTPVSEMGTNYDREDVQRALNKHGIEDEEVVDEVYSLMKKRDELDQQREQEIDELYDRQREIYDELKEEIDEEAERLQDQLDMYLEPVKQREWKLDALPITEVATSLKVMYKAHKDGLLERNREDYQGRLEAFVDQKYESSDEINNYLNKMIDIYEMQDGTSEERLAETFEQAPEYAS